MGTLYIIGEIDCTFSQYYWQIITLTVLTLHFITLTRTRCANMHDP